MPLFCLFTCPSVNKLEIKKYEYVIKDCWYRLPFENATAESVIKNYVFKILPYQAYL